MPRHADARRIERNGAAMVAAVYFFGEPEALSGEFFPFPLNFLLGIFLCCGELGMN
jgi:hypothetical protein